MKMQPTTLQIRMTGKDDGIKIDAMHRPDIPGLYLHPRRDKPGWVISHHSGYAIWFFDRKADAVRILGKLKGLTDWSRPAIELQQDQEIVCNLKKLQSTLKR